MKIILLSDEVSDEKGEDFRDIFSFVGYPHQQVIWFANQDLKQQLNMV